MAKKKTTKKDEIRAQFVIHGIGEMSTKEWNFFKKWIGGLAKEMQAEGREIFNQKRFRATLYK